MLEPRPRVAGADDVPELVEHEALDLRLGARHQQVGDAPERHLHQARGAGEGGVRGGPLGIGLRAAALRAVALAAVRAADGGRGARERSGGGPEGGDAGGVGGEVAPPGGDGHLAGASHQRELRRRRDEAVDHVAEGRGVREGRAHLRADGLRRALREGRGELHLGAEPPRGLGALGHRGDVRVEAGDQQVSAVRVEAADEAGRAPIGAEGQQARVGGPIDAGRGLEAQRLDGLHPSAHRGEAGPEVAHHQRAQGAVGARQRRRDDRRRREHRHRGRGLRERGGGVQEGREQRDRADGEARGVGAHGVRRFRGCGLARPGAAVRARVS